MEITSQKNSAPTQDIPGSLSIYQLPHIAQKKQLRQAMKDLILHRLHLHPRTISALSFNQIYLTFYFICIPGSFSTLIVVVIDI